MKTATIKQKIMFFASPHELYNILMDSKLHSKFSKQKAVISDKVNGRFSAYGNYITGINLELVKDKKIVQSWHASDWPDNHFSKVTFKFKKVKDGCIIDFLHSNVPLDQVDNIGKGWHEFYWHPIKEMLKK